MKDLRPVYFHEARARLIGNRLDVYSALIDAGPLTGSELAARMGWPVTSVRPRLCELRELRHAETTGERRNGEHIFRALSATEAAAIMRAERAEGATVARADFIGCDGLPVAVEYVRREATQMVLL